MSHHSILKRKQKKPIIESTANVYPLFPPEIPDEDTDIETYHVVSSAIAEAWSYEDGSSVTIEEDPILGKECVYLEGPHASLTFMTTCDYRWVVFHLKCKKHFLSIGLVLRDQEGNHRKLTLTNHVSIATMDAPNGSVAQLPLVVGVGWQVIPVDLHALVKAIWGTEYRSIEQVRVKSNCVVRKVFMSDKLYSDFELPEYLRALG